MHSQIALRTDDGTCLAEVFHPDGTGPWPGVLMLHDGIGMRPAMHAVAASIADAGYHVLMPDLFYRMAPYEPADPKAMASDPAVRAAWWDKAEAAAPTAGVLRDIEHYVAHLRSVARGDRIGATGYCMGGRLALTAAGTYPDAFAGVAAYHPGRMVTDAADSPHQVFEKITAKVYIAAASDDPTFPPEHQQIVKDALHRGNVDHVLEVYPAKHGWVPTDLPIHDAGCAKRHLDTLLDLLGRTLS